MSLLKAIKAQLGLSNTPANNFTITAEADNGTLKLARGNAGATTQDILTVDASGNVLVDGNNLNLFSAKSLAAPGYQKLPSGLIIQWMPVITSASGYTAFTFPLAWPTGCFGMTAAQVNTTAQDNAFNYNSLTTTGFNAANFTAAGTAIAQTNFIIAIGR